MAIRCKFTVQSVKAFSKESAEIHLVPVCDVKGIPEDAVFTKYTPSGSFTFGCTNPAVLAQIEPGKQFYVDLTPVE